MTNVTGRFSRIHAGLPFAALVTVSVERPTSAPGVCLELSGSGFESQGIIESAPSSGPYEDWRQAALQGVAFGLRLATVNDARVAVKAIEGRAGTDTTAATVAAAAFIAVCQAFGFVPAGEVQRGLEALVFRSWSTPERVPDLDAEL